MIEEDNRVEYVITEEEQDLAPIQYLRHLHAVTIAELHGLKWQAVPFPLTCCIFIRNSKGELVRAYTQSDAIRDLLNEQHEVSLTTMQSGKPCGEHLLELVNTKPGTTLCPVLKSTSEVENYFDMRPYSSTNNIIDLLVLNASRALSPRAVQERLEGHFCQDLKHHVQRISALPAISREEYRCLGNNGLLDDYFFALIEALAFVKDLPDGLVEISIKELRTSLEDAKKRVLDHYSGLEKEHFIGDPEAFKSPELLVVLGCKEEEIETRGQAARQKYLNSDPKPLIVISGGGFGLEKTEAELMKVHLGDVPEDSVILEKHSMDTIGNAIFTRLMLAKKLGKITHERVCIVTSADHAVRALSVFKSVFPMESQVCVLLAPSNPSGISKLEESLMKEHTTSNSVFSIPHYLTGTAQRIKQGDVVTIFWRMLQTHDLYKGRFDLLRDFRDEIHMFE